MKRLRVSEIIPTIPYRRGERVTERARIFRALFYTMNEKRILTLMLVAAILDVLSTTLGLFIGASELNPISHDIRFSFIYRIGAAAFLIGLYGLTHSKPGGRGHYIVSRAMNISLFISWLAIFWNVVNIAITL